MHTLRFCALCARPARFVRWSCRPGAFFRKVAMRNKGIFKVVCVAGVSALCAFGLAACGSASEGSGQVAATVNGANIYEDDVTEYIENYRASYSLDTEEAWGEWLAQYGYTPESVREDVINSYASREIIKQAIEEYDITVDSSEIDGYVNQMKSNYSSDEAWQSALSQAGLTEDEYREDIELSLQSEQLREQVAPEEEPAEEDVLSYCQMYAAYYDGAKRSSHILFNVDDQETAQQVLDQINTGVLDFAAAATEYSTDEGSAANGGDVGWDKLTSFVTEYTEGLSTLEKGQVSGLVTSDYGIHIIKCTDVFTAPEEVTSSDQMPVEFVDNIKNMLSSQNQSSAYSTWLEERTEAADIQINDMPDGLPYWVDMSQYQTEDESAASVDGDEVSIESEEAAASEDVSAEGAADESAAEGDAAVNDDAAEASDSADSAGSQAAEQKEAA